MTILGVRWFTSGSGCIGIVRTEDNIGVHYFISPVHGRDEELDTQHVADWGASFPVAAGNALFGVTQ